MSLSSRVHVKAANSSSIENSSCISEFSQHNFRLPKVLAWVLLAILQPSRGDAGWRSART
jgi:hypothetical protein